MPGSDLRAARFLTQLQLPGAAVDVELEPSADLSIAHHPDIGNCLARWPS